MRAILGVDLTWSGGLGLCLLPAAWDLEWRRVRVETHAPSPGATPGLRLRQAAEAVIKLAREADLVAIEKVPTRGAFNVTKLAAVEGAVRAELSRALGVEAVEIPISSARKLLFGKGRGPKKAEYHAELVRMGAPAFWGPDEMDAFVIANYAASDGGACALATGGA